MHLTGQTTGFVPVVGSMDFSTEAVDSLFGACVLGPGQMRTHLESRASKLIQMDIPCDRVPDSIFPPDFFSVGRGFEHCQACFRVCESVCETQLIC